MHPRVVTLKMEAVFSTETSRILKNYHPLSDNRCQNQQKKNGPDNSFEIMEIRAGIRTCDLQIRKSIFVRLHGVQMQEGGTGKVVSI